MATGAALMPDAHVGYGLPIGGVLALDNVQWFRTRCGRRYRFAVMKLSVLDMPAWTLGDRHMSDLFEETRWMPAARSSGVGSTHQRGRTMP